MSGAFSSAEALAVARDGLAALAPEWDALAAAAAEANPFYEAWHLLPALEHCEEGANFRCVAVRRNGRLAALFPLALADRWKGLPARVLRSWRNRHMLLCTPLVRRGCEVDAFAALLAWARRQASILELDYFPADGVLKNALADALAHIGRPWMITYAFERALLKRAPGADAYIAAMARGARQELRRRDRRLRETGKARYVRLDRDIERWIDDFLALEASGWKGRAGSALACREADARYARAVLRNAFGRGRLMACGVDLDGRPIGRRLCFVSGEGGLLFKSAYDEACAKLAPGMLAHLETIRAFHDRPGTLQWIDSATGPDNRAANAVWKDRRRIERLAVGVDAWGAVVLALLPALRSVRDRLALRH